MSGSPPIGGSSLTDSGFVGASFGILISGNSCLLLDFGVPPTPTSLAR
jgi:hypothetical protein